MKRPVIFLKTIVVVLGVCLLVATVSFAKIWLNNRDRSAAGFTNVGDMAENSSLKSIYEMEGQEHLSIEGEGTEPDSDSLPIPGGTPDPSEENSSEENSTIEEVTSDDDLNVQELTIDIVHEPITELKDELKDELTTESSIQSQIDSSSNQELYHNILAEFCRNVMEPIGYTLSSEWFTEKGKESDINVILLRFTSTGTMSFEAKKLAATRLGEFIYLGFEEQTGFRTDYLKVHLQLPEGESFALPRENYQKWVASGDGYDLLLENYMPNMITREEIATKEEKQDTFKPLELQQYLNNNGIAGLTFKVEGQEMADSGIYIHMDKARSELSSDEFEDVLVRLCQEVFRNYYSKTNQRVFAFKLIDPDVDTVYVIYRKDMDILWPEGSSEDRIREFIKSGKSGPLS